MNAQPVRRPIVAGVDGSQSALDAVRWAATEARRYDAPLRLVNACPWPKHPFGGEAMGIDYPKAFVRVARDQLDSAVEVAQETVPGIEVEQQVVISYPVPVLVAESGRARLVVLGDRGLGGVSGLLIGSVAVALAAEGACPVVIVRGESPVSAESPKPVVVGVDGASNTEAAVGFAFEAASARGVPLVAVLARQPSLVEHPFTGVLDRDVIEPRQWRGLAALLARWTDKYPGVELRRVVTDDRPAPRLLEEAKHAQLVVVGSRGRGSLTGLVLGSVSHALLHHAACPVAVVRPDTAEP